MKSYEFFKGRIFRSIDEIKTPLACCNDIRKTNLVIGTNDKKSILIKCHHGVIRGKNSVRSFNPQDDLKENHKKRIVRINLISYLHGHYVLLSVKLVGVFLKTYFGKNWHFTITNFYWFISNIMHRLFAMGRNAQNSLICNC